MIGGTLFLTTNSVLYGEVGIKGLSLQVIYL